MKTRLACVLLAFVSIVAVWCSTPTSENNTITQKNNDRIRVVTTFPVLYAHVARIAGDKAEITNLIESGENVHLWQPTPQDVIALENADLLVAHGMWLEEFLHDYKSTLEKNGTTVLEVGEEIEDAHAKDENHADEDKHTDEHSDEDKHTDDHADEDKHTDDHADEGEEAHGHHHGEDPHTWLSINKAQEHTNKIREALIALDPENGELYLTNQSDYSGELNELFIDIAVQLWTMEEANPSQIHAFLVTHDAYSHFFEAHNLEKYYQGGLFEHDDDALSAQEMVNVIALMQDKNVKVIFSEPMFDNKVLDTLAQEQAFVQGELNPTWAPLQADGYIILMRNLADAFSLAMQQVQ